MSDAPVQHPILPTPTVLPKPGWSVTAVLLVQFLNAFGDNLVKLLIIGLALGIAGGHGIGEQMQVYLAIVFALPYILFAPVAGYVSDRFSKKQVILWTQVAQLICYFGFILTLWFVSGTLSLVWCLVWFFGLAVQAAIFSPARSGIMKELVGSAGLGRANGLLQMFMMAGILAGLGVGGILYDALRERGNSARDSALFPMYACAALALLQIVASALIIPVKGNPDLGYSRGIWVQHLKQLGAAYKSRAIGLAVSGMVFFWFMSNTVGNIMVTLGKEKFPGLDGAATREVSIMSAILGVGVLVGGSLGGLICRRRIELGIVPWSALGIALSLLWAWVLPVESVFLYVALGLVGLCGGVFLVPLATFVQDKAKPEERARILSSANLLDCLVGAVGGSLLVGLMLWLHLPSRTQLGVIGLISLGAAIYMTRILPKDMVRVFCLFIIRSVYRVRAVDAERIPATGGVLLLPNHVSYVDALVLSAACERPIRFVMWDVLYRVWWLNSFLRFFGTVPISPTRAKDAIRTVADALREGEVVCLFPEGELTRDGKMVTLQKGFELILRQAGCPAMPVFLDGLWGSIFSYEGGTVFRKWPKKLRYPCVVHFGPVLEVKEATVERVTGEFTEMLKKTQTGTV